MVKQYTSEQIAFLSSKKCVATIREDRLSFTYEFRNKLYEAWVRNPNNETIKAMIIEEEIDPHILGSHVIRDLARNFRDSGRPKNRAGKAAARDARTDEMNQQLLATGMFVRKENGIGFSQDLIRKIYDQYPTVSIEDALSSEGIDPDLVGYQRIRSLRNRLDGNTCPAEDVPSRYDQETIEKLSSCPYVKKITEKHLYLHNAFYNEASSLSMLPIDEILQVFGIDPSLIGVNTRIRIRYKLKNWKKNDKVLDCSIDVQIGVMRRKADALSRLMEKELKDFEKIELPKGSVEKKKVCQWIQKVTDPAGWKDPKFDRSYFLDLFRISERSFYSILKDKDYGKRRLYRDDQDVELVRQTISAYGFRKGIRQIYMLMPEVTGQRFSIRKIRRLMHKYHLVSGIRKVTRSGKETRALIERNRKDNLVQRQFRLHRPGELLLTDVTYLKHGTDKVSYVSASIDPVTGKLAALNISASNNEALVLETLDKAGQTPHARKAVFHSDQGILYFHDVFQKRVTKLGFVQSMSRRGNCWDNAPQENFFSILKTEMDYTSIESVDELRVLLEKYMDYWNNKRKRWGYQRMTPAEYETYLLSLSPEEYEIYLAKERKRFEDMKKASVERIIEDNRAAKARRSESGGSAIC